MKKKDIIRIFQGSKHETENIESHQTFTFSYKKRRRDTGRTSEPVYHQ